jgi:hypothetical protein
VALLILRTHSQHPGRCYTVRYLPIELGPLLCILPPSAPTAFFFLQFNDAHQPSCPAHSARSTSDRCWPARCCHTWSHSSPHPRLGGLCATTEEEFNHQNLRQGSRDFGPVASGHRLTTLAKPSFIRRGQSNGERSSSAEFEFCFVCVIVA